MRKPARIRLLAVLAAAVPLAACAAPAGGAAPAGPSPSPNPAQDTRNADAGTKPASVVQAPAASAAPVAATQQAAPQPAAPSAAEVLAPATAAGAPAPRAAAPDAASGMTAGTTVGDSGTGATDAPAAALPAPVPATPAPAPAPVAMPSGSATGSLLQTMFALVAVLAVLAGLAWFLKRYGPRMNGGSANLRIVGSLNLGGRERLLVVEVGDQWIVVGASPGRVNALATMPRQEGAEAQAGGATLAAHTPPANSFADWLKQTIERRK